MKLCSGKNTLKEEDRIFLLIEGYVFYHKEV